MCRWAGPGRPVAATASRSLLFYTACFLNAAVPMCMCACACESVHVNVCTGVTGGCLRPAPRQVASDRARPGAEPCWCSQRRWTCDVLRVLGVSLASRRWAGRVGSGGGWGCLGGGWCGNQCRGHSSTVLPGSGSPKQGEVSRVRVGPGLLKAGAAEAGTRGSRATPR